MDLKILLLFGIISILNTRGASMITWDDFNNTNKENKTLAFENLCRILFNYHFFNNKAIFTQKLNNPGVEIEPIELDGNKVSFQSKYFSSTQNMYAQIKQSVQKTVEHYGDSLDVIYLFSNKDLDINCKPYKDILSILVPHNIKIIRICNQEILSIIETNKYNTIIQLFFGKHNLTAEWFDNNLKTALEDLNPRYVSGFNIDTSTQSYFEIKYLSDEIIGELSDYLETIKKNIKNIRMKLPAITNIKIKIDELKIPEKHNFNIIFDWIKMFAIEQNELNKELDKCRHELEECKDDKKIKDLYSKYNDIYEVLDIINQLDMSQNTLFNSFNSNVLLIEGEAGIGKSHLLGFEAEKHGNVFNRTILLLGQKLIGDSSPMIQIREQLNTTLNIDDLLDALEGMGEIDNSNTVIMIDALNESANHKIWKSYLNDLVNKILNYKHIKLIASIRTTYLDQIFSDAIKRKIQDNQIIKIAHRGFAGKIDEAITKFFTYYNIPVTTSAFLGYSFANPLFLKIYCQVYKNSKECVGSKSVFEIFNQYIIEEENKIKDNLNSLSSFPHCRKILENVACFLYEKNKNHIDIVNLYEINKSIPSHEDFIPYMLKSKLLLSYFYDNEEIVYFGYERMSDFYIAQSIMNRCQSYDNLKDIINNELLLINKHKRFIRSNAIGIFSALSILASEQFGEEIISTVDLDTINEHEKQELIEDYLQNLIFRNDNRIDAGKLIITLKPYLCLGSLEDSFLNILILLAGRENNPLNANYLHELLSKQDLNWRDYFWTIFVNSQDDDSSSLHHTINYFLNKKFIGNYTTKKLYSILLSWTLTSSNRSIRDTASRSLINLLTDDYRLMNEILVLFQNVNDPYVIQRLYGIIYGAVLKSTIDREQISILSNNIFKIVFITKRVYPDILLRDYALNIIEYAQYLNCDLDFDINKCRPTYLSDDINKFDENIEQAFKFDGENYTGLNAIRSSIIPNIDGGYGDFGRYVFEYAITYFKGVKLKDAYLFALDFIKNTLGYKNELFSEYDKNINRNSYDRHHIIKTERIGKKYEWIAFYNILARISDNYEVDNRYFDYRSKTTYLGAWNPYVRDFDPTLDLVTNEKIYNLSLELNQPIYSNLGVDANWANNEKDVIDFSKLIFLIDNNKEEWVFLHGHLNEQSSKDYKHDYKEIWRMVSAYIINDDEYHAFISKLKKKPLWGRWFPESDDRYNIFCREFCWSPAYKDEYKNETFEVSISTSKKIQKTIKNRSLNVFETLLQEYSENVEMSQPDVYSYVEQVRETIGVVKPLWNSYLWEEEYDASKKDTIRVHLPIKEIIEFFNLKQTKTGLFYDEEELVVADFSFVVGNTVGLYIKKSYLEKFLQKTHCNVFWICIGEKNDIKTKGGFSYGEDSIFMDFSSLVYYEGDKITSSDFFGNRYEHN